MDTDIYTVYCMIYSHSNVLHCCELHFTLVHIKATACASDSIGIRGISLCVNFSAFHFSQHLHISCCRYSFLYIVYAFHWFCSGIGWHFSVYKLLNLVHFFRDDCGDWIWLRLNCGFDWIATEMKSSTGVYPCVQWKYMLIA